MRMLVTLEFADAGTKSGTHRVLIIGRAADNLQAGDIGLSLDEAKTLMTAIQEEFVSAQAAEIVDKRRQCGCGKKLNIKDWKLRRIHTALGRVYLPSPRLISCACGGSKPRAISPLKGWPTRSTNELRYLSAGLAAQHSYRQAAAILHELLPVHPKFSHVSVRAATLDAGSRLDQDPVQEPFRDWRRRHGTMQGYARLRRRVRSTYKKGAASEFRNSDRRGRNRRKNLGICYRTQGRRRTKTPTGRLRQSSTDTLGAADIFDDRRRRIVAEAKGLVTDTDAIRTRLFSRVDEAATHRPMHWCNTPDCAIPQWIDLRTLRPVQFSAWVFMVR